MNLGAPLSDQPRSPSASAADRAEIDNATGSLDSLLAMSDKDLASGLGDLPWPPHYPKAEGEPIRAQPSRRRQKT